MIFGGLNGYLEILLNSAQEEISTLQDIILNEYLPPAHMYSLEAIL